ncbi:hypothetical protein ElyMa_006388600 [Elysia marginata]|uniref:Uncharacterized protein n=1 Tax=Elysia marginata TaxID=1093978 RepID=A0AAV4HSN7_9GAST|nr:hypothetical protein ElyMa_006388600 [Elysia marginata]
METKLRVLCSHLISVYGIRQIQNQVAVADHESDVDNNVLSHVTDLAQRQKEDPTLKPWFERLGKPPVHSVSFVLSDGLLFREFYRQKSGLYDRTLVVPASLRNQVLSSAHDSSLAGTVKPLLRYKVSSVGQV